MSDLCYKVRFYSDIRIFFSEVDIEIVEVTASYFRESLADVSSYFDITECFFPVFNIFILRNRKEYDLFVQKYTKIPTGSSRIAQPQSIDLYILSPNAYSNDAPMYYDKDLNSYNIHDYGRTIKHEVVHMIEEMLSPFQALETRPSWFGEGLAVYLSKQYREEDEWMESLIEERELGIPMIKELRGKKAYIFGWTLVKYIEEKIGAKGLKRIIEKSKGDDIFIVARLDREQIEREWKEYLVSSILKERK